MYSADFDYYAAGSVTEAVQLLSQHPGAMLLAGGHSLIPLLESGEDADRVVFSQAQKPSASASRWHAARAWPNAVARGSMPRCRASPATVCT